LRDQICCRVEQLITEVAREDAEPVWMDWNAFLPKQLEDVWN